MTIPITFEALCASLVEHHVAFAAVTPDGTGSVAIGSVTHDSRAVRPGSLFCCIRGARTDGHFFAEDAVAAGVSAVLVDHRLQLSRPVPQLVVTDTRRAMGPVAAAVLGYPGDALELIGITGTNGKTTTAHMVAAILGAAGRKTAVIGTLTQQRTTPEGTDLQNRLAELRDEGFVSVVMEVTSHALELHRVDGLHFRVGVFTNLSQDHLDFHTTMEAYFRAKARLFEPGFVDEAVVNADDLHGHLLIDAATVPTTKFGLNDTEALTLGPSSSTFRWRGTTITLSMGGAFNVLNALAAAVTADRLGIDHTSIAAGLASVTVAGRYEPVDAGQPFAVVVDFAHTPDGLERVLRAARATLGRGHRLIVVFGCGGDRDRAKRPQMGAIAATLADVAVLTSDNPRSEDPVAILAEVEAGVPAGRALLVEPDRRVAIGTALRNAAPGDVVVIAGKGHEMGQEIAGVVHPFDDRLVAREELRRLLGVGTPI